MLDALYKHGLLGGSGGVTLTEQIDKSYVVATGETISLGDPIYLDSDGKVRKVKASERGLNERKVGINRDMANYIYTDSCYGQVLFIPNSFETRFALLEATPTGRAQLKICAIRNGELLVLTANEFSNQYQGNSQLGNWRMGYNPFNNCLYVSYENWSTTTRGYITIYKMTPTHTDVSCTLVNSLLNFSGYTSASGNTWHGGMILQKDGSVLLHGNNYNGTTYYNVYAFVTSAFAASTNSTGFLGYNASSVIYLAVDYSIAYPAYNCGLCWNYTTPSLWAVSGNSFTGNLVLSAGTHYIGSINTGTTKRFRNTEERYISVYTTDQLNREFRLGLLVYTYNGTAFTINNISFTKTRYNMTIYNSWLIKENRIMVLALDNSISKYRLFVIDIDNTTNVASITKEIVLSGNGRTFHGADYYNGVLILSTTESYHGIIRSYYFDGDDIRERLNNGIASQNGAAGDTIKVVLKGKVQGLSGLTKDKDYYVQRDGTLGTDNRGNHIAYADSDNTLIIDVPFYEKETVTIV